MTDMPERIFAWYFLESLQNESMLGGWDSVTDHKEQEYIRNDLYNDMVSERDAAFSNINIKAAFIGKTLNESAADAKRIYDLEVENKRLREQITHHRMGPLSIAPEPP